MESKHDTRSPRTPRRGLFATAATGLLTVLAACASTTMPAPAGHPARSDAPAAPAANPATVLLPDTAEPDNAEDGDAKPDGVEHLHGKPEAPASPQPSEDAGDGHGGHEGDGSQGERSPEETEDNPEPHQHQHGHGS